MFKGGIKVGTYEGTGAAITLEIGFVPDFFLAVNTEDGDDVWIWFNGMAAATTVNIAAAAATEANGVTAYAGASTVGSEAAPGLTLGTALSESGKTHYYIAIRMDG